MDAETTYWRLRGAAEVEPAIGEGGEFSCIGPDGRELCAPTMRELDHLLWARCLLIELEDGPDTPPYHDQPIPNTVMSVPSGCEAW